MPRKLRNWLLGYRDYTLETESPEVFHMWVGLSVLSAVTRRRIKIPFGYQDLYPNLYVILVSPPGTCRKSSAMGYGKWFLDQIKSINLEANKLTPESLINSLASASFSLQPSAIGSAGSLVKNAAGMIYSTELSVTLGANALQNGLLGLLTDLFDSPDNWEYKTLSRGKETLNGVFLTILSATTPSFLSRTIPQDAIGDGFASRVIHVYRNERRADNPLPVLTLKQLKLRQELLADLQEISKLKGTLSFDPAAIAYYDAWYRSKSVPVSIAKDERFGGYRERRPIHVLKVAALISISFSDSLVITEAHIKMAVNLLENIEIWMPDAFRSMGALGWEEIKRIFTYVELAGGAAKYSSIVHDNLRSLTHPQIESIVKTLIVAKVFDERIHNGDKIIFIRKKIDTNGSGGAPTNEGLELSGGEPKNLIPGKVDVDDGECE